MIKAWIGKMFQNYALHKDVLILCFPFSFNFALSGVVSIVLNMPAFGAILAAVAFHTARVM